ncbi:unnamed protein product [Eruca vesicaria subsp. sativa]|uniref:Zinc finger GRF-type domain-containing protein n=1 Tax=Eruca vesicaria subsp. sativa TaxID=29727 RepID=A0ABC8M3Z7_ERUVS|nr:unnamed protein product [Eruca vesicaria subsp. sativa]
MEKLKMEKLKMYVGLGSLTRSQNSGQGFCFCASRANITQSWTDKNPGRRFYSSPHGCDYFSWFDEEECTKWQRRVLIEARDEINRKSAVIEQLTKNISEMKRNFENKETVDDENEDEIVRKFVEFYV